MARAVAEAAATELLAVRSSPLAPAEVGKLGDQRSHRLIVSALTEACPGDWILSEESADDPARLQSNRVWIVDPLDGTREFTEAGRTDWAVHIALVRGGGLDVGVVALPALGLVLASANAPTPPPRDGRIRLVVSRTRPPNFALAVGRRLDAELLPMGSAGAKAMAVVLGEADVYIHAGGQHEWDSAAPIAVARAAGLHTSRIDGSALVYNRHPAWQPDLLICRPELAGRVLEAIGKELPSEGGKEV